METSLNPVEQLAHITVRIETHYENGGFGFGTGFFIHFPTSDEKFAPFIATNRHVVEGAVRATFVLSERDAKGGLSPKPPARVNLMGLPTKYISHPNPEVDLCLLPIGPIVNQGKQQGVRFFYNSIDFMGEMILGSEEIAEFVGMEEIVMVGYPQGLWDEVNNRPVFRSGILASDFRYDWNGNKEFLIDMACFPGSSGSPIFLYNPIRYMKRSGAVIASRLKFLGFLSRGPQFSAKGEIVVSEVPAQLKPIAISQIPMNLGIAIKAEAFMDFQGNLPGLLAELIARDSAQI